MNYDQLSHSNYCSTTFLQQAFKASQCHRKMQSIMEVRNSKRESERERAKVIIDCDDNKEDGLCWVFQDGAQA